MSVSEMKTEFLRPKIKINQCVRRAILPKITVIGSDSWNRCWFVRKIAFRRTKYKNMTSRRNIIQIKIDLNKKSTRTWRLFWYIFFFGQLSTHQHIGIFWIFNRNAYQLGIGRKNMNLDMSPIKLRKEKHKKNKL